MPPADELPSVGPVQGTSWTSVTPVADPAAVLTIVAVQLRLRRAADAVALAAWADRLRPELDRTAGLVGYSARRTSRALWVVSAWSHRDRLAAFESGPLHTAAKRELHPLLHPPVVGVWRAGSDGIPPPWTDVRGRLRAAERRTRARLDGG